MITAPTDLYDFQHQSTTVERPGYNYVQQHSDAPDVTGDDVAIHVRPRFDDRAFRHVAVQEDTRLLGEDDDLGMALTVGERLVVLPLELVGDE